MPSKHACASSDWDSKSRRVLPTPVRNDGVSRHSTPAGDVAYAAIPNMVPVFEAQRSHRQAPQSNVSSRCRKALAIWRTPWFLAASGTMGIVLRCVVVATDASTKGGVQSARGEA